MLEPDITAILMPRESSARSWPLHYELLVEKMRRGPDEFFGEGAHGRAEGEGREFVVIPVSMTQEPTVLATPDIMGFATVVVVGRLSEKAIA